MITKKLKKHFEQYNDERNIRDLSSFFLGFGVMFFIMNVITMNTAYLVSPKNFFYGYLASMLFTLTGSVVIILLSYLIFKITEKRT